MKQKTEESFILAQANQLFVPTFRGQIFTLENARTKARKYSFETGETVYIWSLDESPKPDGQHLEKISPFYVEPDHYFQLWVNQGYRDSIVRAVIEAEALIEYTMPKLSTALRIIPAYLFDGSLDQKIDFLTPSIPYIKIPQKWLSANPDIIKYGNPQGQNRRRA